MKLQDMEFIKLLPEFMRDDPANAGLAKAMDNIFKSFADYGKQLSIWTAVDELPERDLDKLAWELNLTWYEQNADIDTKRKLIKNHVEIRRQLGTGWAVEQVISAYFGTGYIEEWFEYGGQPGYFKVVSSNPSITNENLDKFLRVLSKIKRASAHLQGVYIGLSGKSTVNAGVAVREVTRISTRAKYGDEINGWKSEVNAGVAVREIEKIAVSANSQEV